MSVPTFQKHSVDCLFPLLKSKFHIHSTGLGKSFVLYSFNFAPWWTFLDLIIGSNVKYVLLVL
jgi:hypothetical protein